MKFLYLVNEILALLRYPLKHIEFLKLGELLWEKLLESTLEPPTV